MSFFLSPEQLKLIRKKLKKKPGSFIVTDDYPLIQRTKRDLCASLILFQKEKGFTHLEFAKKLSISETKLKNLLRYHFDACTLDDLMSYLRKVDLKCEIK